MRVRTLSGIELEWDEIGRGPAMLLIAGTASERSIWSAARPELAKHFRTIAFDPRDAGQSTIAIAPYGLVELAEDARSVLDAAGVRAAHVVGHSLGGMVAQQLAAQHGARVSRLSLVCTWLAPDQYLENFCSLLRDLSREIDDDALRLRLIDFVALGPRMLERVSLTEIVAEELAAGPAQPKDAVARQWDLDRTIDTIEIASQIRCPTQVMWGSEDRIIPAAQAQALLSRISGATETRLAGVGHCPMLEEPDTFVAAIRAFAEPS